MSASVAIARYGSLSRPPQMMTQMFLCFVMALFGLQASITGYGGLSKETTAVVLTRPIGCPYQIGQGHERSARHS